MILINQNQSIKKSKNQLIFSPLLQCDRGIKTRILCVILFSYI